MQNATLPYSYVIAWHPTEDIWKKRKKRGLAFLKKKRILNKKRGKIQALCFQTFKLQEKHTVKLNPVK
jgi:hypothetical protein